MCMLYRVQTHDEVADRRHHGVTATYLCHLVEKECDIITAQVDIVAK